MCNPLEYGWAIHPFHPGQFYISNAILQPSQRLPGCWRLAWLGKVWRVPDYLLAKETWLLQQQLEVNEIGMVLDDEV